MIDKVVEIGFLFDIYGNLLSERQYSVIEMYYINDLSLQEIGDELDISRQGVYDTLKRAENNLYEYESILQLGSRLQTYNIEIEKINDIISILYEKIGDKDSFIEENILKIQASIKIIMDINQRM